MGLTLGVQTDCALFELVEGRVVGAIDANEFLLKPFQLALALAALRFDQGLELLVQLVQVVLPALDVLLSFKQEDLLLLVVVLDCLGESIFPILQHLDKELKFLIELGQR